MYKDKEKPEVIVEKEANQVKNPIPGSLPFNSNPILKALLRSEITEGM